MLNPLGPDWEFHEISHEGKNTQFPYHIPSGSIFNSDPHLLIRGKCAALIVLTPIVTVVRTTYWISKAIFLTLAEGYCYLDGEKASEKAWNVIQESFQDSVRAIKYGALMTGCAVVGTVFPYQARLKYGQLEKQLNRHEDGPHRDKFYLAYCFQPISRANVDSIAQILLQHIIKIEKIRTAFWSCDIETLMIELKLLKRAML